MTKEKAELVARFVLERLIQPQEPLVLVYVLEENGYLPQVFVNERISECIAMADSEPRIAAEGGWVVRCKLSGSALIHTLDNPEIHDITGTLHFRIKNVHDQQIFRSFTLMRPYKNREEQWLWLKWKHNLI